MVPVVLLVSSAACSDTIVISGEIGVTKISRSLSNISLSNSHSHAVAKKSSSLMITSGYGCLSCGVTGMSGIV